MACSQQIQDNPSATSLGRLLDGNRRHVAGKPQYPRQSLEDRQRVVEAQRPIAAILGCADSRVPPELIFDQGVGDLFIVRVAGNIVNSDLEHSLEFAVEQLGVPLIVVLGHQDCGAVQLTVDAMEGGQDIVNHPNSLVRAIAPAARNQRTQTGNAVEDTVRENVLQSVSRLRAGERLSQHVASGDLQILGAYYRLDSGAVELLEE